MNKLTLQLLLIVIISVPIVFAEEMLETKQLLSADELLVIKNEYLNTVKTRTDVFNTEINEAMVTGKGNTSIVSYLQTNETIITNDEFNQRVKNEYSLQWEEYLELRSNSKPEIDANKLRDKILYSVLEDAFITTKWNETKKNREFVDLLRNETIQSENELSKYISDSILHVRYNQYFPTLFIHKNRSLFVVLTSTDSLLLDSILEVTDNVNVNNGNLPQKALLKAGYCADLYYYDSLETNMKKIADTLSTNSWSIIERTNWGYYVLGLYNKNIHKQITFNEAIPQLLYLPDIENIKKDVFIPEDSLLDYYNKNKHPFCLNDSQLLTITILPNVYKSINSKNRPSICDFSTEKTIACLNADLPNEIRDVIAGDIRIDENDCSDWLYLYYGRWKICVDSNFKRGILQYADCRERIQNKLHEEWVKRIIAEVETTPQAKEDDRSYSLFRNYFLSKSFLLNPDDKNFNVNGLKEEVEKWAKANIIITIP